MLKVLASAVVLCLIGLPVGAQDDEFPSFELKAKPFYVLGSGHPEFSVEADKDMDGFGVYASNLRIKRGGTLIYESGEDWSTDTADVAEFGWELLDQNGEEVLPGLYTVTVRVTAIVYETGDDYCDEDFEAEFYLLPKSRGTLVFRTTKTSYVQDKPVGKDPVIFYVLNRGTRAVTIPAGRPWEIVRFDAAGKTRRVAQSPSVGRASVTRNQAQIWGWDQRERGTLSRAGNFRATLRLSGGTVWNSNFKIVAN